jgi:hypothetical protein
LGQYGAAEGGQLNARSDAGSVQVGRGSIRHLVQHSGQAALKPDHMRPGRIRPVAELIEATAGTKGPALATQFDTRDSRVDQRNA